VYETENGEATYTPPEGTEAAQVFQDLQSGKQLSELWPEAEAPGPDEVF